MRNGVTRNQDLIWTLGGKEFSESAYGFLKRFESALCLFSNTVSQLYSNYEIVHFGHEGRKLVALPNAFAAHDTFNNVDCDAIEATGLYIVPEEATRTSDKNGLLLLYRCSKTGKPKTLTLADGLGRVKSRYMPKEPFLPVMINRDLRSLKGNLPAMHLHRLRIDKLLKMSDLEKGDILKTVNQKMEMLYR